MALFSRKKSKAKKAEKQEEEKAAANAPKPAAAKPARGRNGRPVATPSEPAIANIPAPSQLPRHYDDPSSGIGKFARGGPVQPQDANKYDTCDAYPNADSGYGSAGPGSQLQSRNPSSHQLSQQRDYSVGLGKQWLSRDPAFLNNQFMQDDLHGPADPALDSADNGFDRGPRHSKSLRASRNQHENDPAPGMPFQDRTPKHQDPRQQRKIQQSMPMRPSSVPPQALQSRSERVSRPQVHRSSSPGPELQRSHTMRSPPSRNSAPLNVGRPYGWFEQASSQLQFQQRSPTSPMREDFGQDEPSPSMGILFGLKVNRRGLILDEEGDPIAELYEGDIIDCVRQRADAHGNVLDEYGRIVGRVRMLPSRNAEPILRPFTPKANEGDQSYTSPPPPLPNNKTGVEAQSPDCSQPNSPQQVWTGEDSPVEAQNSSPPRVNGAASGRDNITETSKPMVAPSDYRLEYKDPPSPRKEEHNYVQEQEHSVPRLQAKSSFIKAPESLPSVPESDDDSRSAGGMSEDRTDEQRSVDEQTLRQDAAPTNESKAKHTSAQFEQAVSQQVDLISTTHPLEGHDNSIAVAKPNRSSTSLALPTGSMAEARALPANGLPPVPALPKDLQGFKKTVLASERPVVVAHAQPITLQATPSRMKSPPLPSFPGRGGLNNGSAGGSPFANAQMPGMPARRLTTPGMSAPTPFGMAGMGPQPPAFRSRLSGTTPLVRSPLSSQENSPPESEQGSTAGDSRTAPQHQGHSRSQSVKTTKSTSVGAPGTGGRPRRTFAHANRAGAANKDADVVVKEVADEGKKKAEKKKGIKGLFGGKKKA